MRTLIPIVLAGCGRIGFSTRPDARSSDLGSDALGAFSTPQPLTQLNSTFEDDDPTLTDDELELYFSSTRPGGQGTDIWRSERPSTSAPWGPPTNVAELNTAAVETTPELTADGLTMFFSRGVGNNDDIFVTTRPVRGEPWSTPVRVAELASGTDDIAPATSSDQLTMVFTRGLVTVDAQLYLTTRGSLADTWSPPVVVLDAAGQQEDQAWVGDEDIYYTINTPNLQGIYRAQRLGSVSFGSPVAIPELDLPGSESDPWLPISQHAIYFEHEDDLYVAYR